ncbi:RrF2 family transcriptional regulator [Planctomycetota bacterium]
MFHVSTKLRYGLRSMVDLALRGTESPLSLKELSKDQDISKKYLENIFTMLHRNGIVRSIRGAKGGYQLARDPATLTVVEILDAIDGPVELIECIETPDNCPKSRNCLTRDFWAGLEGLIKDYLRYKTLQELVDEYKKNNENYTGMFI